MNTILKRTIMILLVVSILISSVSFIGSAKEPVPDYPKVNISGFMSGFLYEDKDDPSSEQIYPVSEQTIISLVKECIPALIALSASQDWDLFADMVIPVLNNHFGSWINNPDGTPPGNTGVKKIYPSAEMIYPGSELYFSYDWRMDPVAVAAELNDYINYICSVSGYDKVAVSCHSLGGIIFLSYISIYGDSKINAVVLDSTAIYGETYTGELLTGDLQINKDSLTAYLQFVFDGNENEALLDDIFVILRDAGVLDFVCRFAEDIVANLADRAYPEFVAPLFAGWPTIWAMVPDELVDEAKEYVFGTIYKNSDIDRSGLAEKIDSYNELVRKNKEQTLLELDKEAGLAVISRYGYCSIPATESWQNTSDGVVDTHHTSFGATVAPYGEALSEDYLEGKDMAYISPDRTVDASTCLFPEKTWFIKNLKHSDHCAVIDEMIRTLLFSPEEVTVDTYKEFPRFMEYDYSSDTVSQETVAEEVSFLGKIRSFLEAIYNLVMFFINR